MKAPTPATGQLAVSANFESVTNHQLVGGLHVTACAKLDPSCASPLWPEQVTDATGTARFTVAPGYDGFLQVTWSDDAGPPILVYVNPPVVTPGPLGIPVGPYAALTHAEIDSLVRVAGSNVDGGLRIDPALGHLTVTVATCLGGFGAGVKLSVSDVGPQTIGAYLINGIPIQTATETDMTGEFIMLNLQPGAFSVAGTVTATGQKIGTTSGFIRPGRFTYVSLVPSP